MNKKRIERKKNTLRNKIFKVIGVILFLAFSFFSYFLFARLYESMNGRLIPLFFLLIPIWIINLIAVESLQDLNKGSLI